MDTLHLEIKKAYSNILDLLFISDSSSNHRNNTFFAHYLTKLPLRISKDVDVAGVGLSENKDYACLYLGENFLKYSKLEKIAILLHEVYHLICKHPLRRNGRHHLRYNYACDLAINQKILNIPKNGLHVKQFKLPYDLTSEIYYDLLKDDKYLKAIENFIESLENGDLDTHDLWDQLSEENKIKIEAQLNSISEQAKQKCRGNISADLNELINLNKHSNKVHWLSILRKNATNKSTEKKETLKKRNRRYRDNPNIRGHKKSYKSTVTVILDVSGSMSSDFDIAQPLAEIKNLCRQLSTQVDLIQVDTEVKKIEKFSQNSTNFSRSGNGGTLLYPAIEYCIKKNVNIENLVIITDGCIEDYWDNPPKSNVIFLLPGLNKLSLSTDNFPKKPRIFNV